MIRKCYILSDLWGSSKKDWWQLYITGLSNIYDIEFLDSCQLAEIDPEGRDEPYLHSAFVNGGIEKAAKKLASMSAPDTVIGISVGGVIAWKAMLYGWKVNTFVGVSATRLRYEKLSPDSNIQLYYGAEDLYKPKLSWQSRMGLSVNSIVSKGHNLYRESQFIEKLEHDLQRSNLTLFTSRFQLRPIALSDLQSYFELKSSAEIFRYLEQKAATDKSDVLNQLQRLIAGVQHKKYYLWAITPTADSDQLLGTICLWNISEDGKNAFLGYELHPDYWNQGIVSEAICIVIDFGLKQVGFTKIQAETHIENIASQRVLMKNGFTRNEVEIQDVFVTFEINHN